MATKKMLIFRNPQIEITPDLKKYHTMGILFQTSIDFNIIYEIMILYENFRKLKAKLFVCLYVIVSFSFWLLLDAVLKFYLSSKCIPLLSHPLSRIFTCLLPFTIMHSVSLLSHFFCNKYTIFSYLEVR